MAAKPKREVVRRTIELPPELETQLRALAEEHTRSVNQEMVHALRLYVASLQKEEIR